jgi:hypothetical protein
MQTRRFLYIHSGKQWRTEAKCRPWEVRTFFSVLFFALNFIKIYIFFIHTINITVFYSSFYLILSCSCLHHPIPPPLQYCRSYKKCYPGRFVILPPSSTGGKWFLCVFICMVAVAAYRVFIKSLVTFDDSQMKSSHFIKRQCIGLLSRDNT